MAFQDATNSQASHGRVRPFDQWLARSILGQLRDPPIRIVLWDGEEIRTNDSPATGRILFRDRRTLLSVVFDPDMQFGEAYADGRIRLEGDLIDSLSLAYVPDAKPTPLKNGVRLLRQLQRRANTLDGSKRNIHYHYDLGNDFYKLWLDEEMSYTCAYFPTREATLEEAQLAKMEHVCRKVDLQPGQHVIEAGCGWGSLALYMARNHGVTVTAYNISREQIEYARKRAKREGLEDRVEFVEDDYRTISEGCDAFVSVGMLEHVGVHQYRDLGAVIDRSLAKNGLGLIHSIGRVRSEPLSPWIERRIFPGAYPPTITEMLSMLEPWDLSVLDVENLRLHYEMTLRRWLERYEKSFEQVVQKFDESFARAWRLYLAGSAAAFEGSSLHLFQLTFSRATNNDIPWTRAHLYRDA